MTIPDPLSDKEIEDRLAELPGWRLGDDGDTLVRVYRLPHLAAAVLALHIARIQDETGHHGDLTVKYNTLTVSITTHEAQNTLTARDFDLARRIAEVAPAHGAE
jgi:4a-hydroxytetrahydrobiopterin dehydratase